MHKLTQKFEENLLSANKDYAPLEVSAFSSNFKIDLNPGSKISVEWFVALCDAENFVL